VNESTLRWKWQGSKDIPQVSQALGTFGITITCTKLTDIILIDLFTIFKVLAHLKFA